MDLAERLRCNPTPSDLAVASRLRLHRLGGGLLGSVMAGRLAESPGVRIKTDQCAGPSFIRSYATVTSSTDNTDDVVAYCGTAKSV